MKLGLTHSLSQSTLSVHESSNSPQSPQLIKVEASRAAQNIDQGGDVMGGERYQVGSAPGQRGVGPRFLSPPASPSSHCSSLYPHWRTMGHDYSGITLQCAVPQGRTVLRSFQSRPPQVCSPGSGGMEPSSQHVSGVSREELKSTVHRNQISPIPEDTPPTPQIPGQEPVWGWCHQPPPHSSATSQT